MVAAAARLAALQCLVFRFIRQSLQSSWYTSSGSVQCHTYSWIGERRLAASNTEAHHLQRSPRVLSEIQVHSIIHLDARSDTALLRFHGVPDLSEGPQPLHADLGRVLQLIQTGPELLSTAASFAKGSQSFASQIIG